ncbi:MAG: hypothetical protein ACPLTQ_13400, partial [Anaerolineae bacterium]
AHVGDSRAYLLRKGEARLPTSTPRPPTPTFTPAPTQLRPTQPPVVASPTPPPPPAGGEQPPPPPPPPPSRP